MEHLLIDTTYHIDPSLTGDHGNTFHSGHDGFVPGGHEGFLPGGHEGIVPSGHEGVLPGGCVVHPGEHPYPIPWDPHHPFPHQAPHLPHADPHLPRADPHLPHADPHLPHADPHLLRPDPHIHHLQSLAMANNPTVPAGTDHTQTLLTQHYNMMSGVHLSGGGNGLDDFNLNGGGTFTPPGTNIDINVHGNVTHQGGNTGGSVGGGLTVHPTDNTSVGGYVDHGFPNGGTSGGITGEIHW